MFNVGQSSPWLLVNFLLYTVSAAIASVARCYSGSACLIDKNTPVLDIALAPLAIALCWMFTWGILCLTFGLECNAEDDLKGVKAGLSYVLALICGAIFPIIVVGG
ncbi:MAG: hypothetical protein GY814_19840 [Gammaproteobacteria bacterium]|nr:hypothetical protein [Gammaproteobacteria bacterium]